MSGSARRPQEGRQRGRGRQEADAPSIHSWPNVSSTHARSSPSSSASAPTSSHVQPVSPLPPRANSPSASAASAGRASASDPPERARKASARWRRCGRGLAERAGSGRPRWWCSRSEATNDLECEAGEGRGQEPWVVSRSTCRQEKGEGGGQQDALDDAQVVVALARLAQVVRDERVADDEARAGRDRDGCRLELRVKVDEQGGRGGREDRGGLLESRGAQGGAVGSAAESTRPRPMRERGGARPCRQS